MFLKERIITSSTTHKNWTELKCNLSTRRREIKPLCSLSISIMSNHDFQNPYQISFVTYKISIQNSTRFPYFFLNHFWRLDKMSHSLARSWKLQSEYFHCFSWFVWHFCCVKRLLFKLHLVHIKDRSLRGFFQIFLQDCIPYKLLYESVLVDSFLPKHFLKKLCKF